MVTVAQRLRRRRHGAPGHRRYHGRRLPNMVHRATAGTTADGCTAPQPTARPEGLGVRSSIQNPIRTGEATAQYAYVMAVTYQIRALATHAARRNTYPHAYPTLYNRSPVLAFRFCGVPDPGR